MGMPLFSPLVKIIPLYTSSLFRIAGIQATGAFRACLRGTGYPLPRGVTALVDNDMS